MRLILSGTKKVVHALIFIVGFVASFFQIIADSRSSLVLLFLTYREKQSDLFSALIDVCNCKFIGVTKKIGKP